MDTDEPIDHPAFRTLAAVGVGYVALLIGTLLVVFLLPYVLLAAP
ncbi:hypothetical protein ACERIT_09045 [Halopenitus sp. H-Gu1]